MNIDDALTAYRGELINAAQRWQKARARRRHRIALVTSALAVAGIIVGTAIAATGWLVGSPAPKSVKSDFGSYAPQLGFNPQPGKAVLVASNGAYQLYATTNKQGGICILVSAPWKRPGPNGEGGDCSPKSQNSLPFWAGLGGAANHPNGTTTLVVDGRTTDAHAASLQFDDPTGNTLNVPVGSGGFFIVGMTTHASWCQIARWTPLVTILDSSGKQLGSTTARTVAGAACMSEPNPTVSTQNGHKVFAIDATRSAHPTGYIAGARIGDLITCRGEGAIAKLAVPVRHAHTISKASRFRGVELDVRRRHGRVWVMCG